MRPICVFKSQFIENELIQNSSNFFSVAVDCSIDLFQKLIILFFLISRKVLSLLPLVQLVLSILQKVHQFAHFINIGDRLLTYLVFFCVFGLMIFLGISVAVITDFLLCGLKIAEMVLAGFQSDQSFIQILSQLFTLLPLSQLDLDQFFGLFYDLNGDGNID